MWGSKRRAAGRSSIPTPPGDEPGHLMTPEMEDDEPGHPTSPEGAGPRVETEAPVRRRGGRRLRARLSNVAELRDRQLRDLGGLVFDLYRFGQQRDGLVRGKLEALIATDGEMRELRREADPYLRLRPAKSSVGSCPNCGGLYGAGSSFCRACGLSLRGDERAVQPVRDEDDAERDAEPAPAPEPEAQSQATTSPAPEPEPPPAATSAPAPVEAPRAPADSPPAAPPAAPPADEAAPAKRRRPRRRAPLRRPRRRAKPLAEFSPWRPEGPPGEQVQLRPLVPSSPTEWLPPAAEGEPNPAEDDQPGTDAQR